MILISSSILHIYWLFYVVLFLFTITDESYSIFSRNFCIWFWIYILFFIFCSYFTLKNYIYFMFDYLSTFASSEVSRSSSKTDCFMYACFFTFIRWRYYRELMTSFQVKMFLFSLFYFWLCDYFFKSISSFLNSKETNVLF